MVYNCIYRKYNSLFFVLLLLQFNCNVSFAGVLYSKTSPNKNSILFSSLISTSINVDDVSIKDEINIKNIKENIKEEEKKEEDVKKNEEKKDEEIEKNDNYKCSIQSLNLEMCSLYGILIKLSYNIDSEYKELFYLQCKKIYDILLTLKGSLCLSFGNEKYEELISIIGILLKAIDYDENNIFLSDLIYKKDVFFTCCEVRKNNDVLKTLVCFLKSFCKDKMINSLRFVVDYNRTRSASYFTITFNKTDNDGFLSLVELLKDLCIKIIDKEKAEVAFKRYNKKEQIAIDNKQNLILSLVPKKQNTFSLSINKNIDVSKLSVVIYNLSSKEELVFSNF